MLPALSALSIITTSGGCTLSLDERGDASPQDPMVGSWRATGIARIAEDGSEVYGLVLPDVYQWEDGSTRSMGARMHLEVDGSGQMVSYKTVRFGADEPLEYVYLAPLVGTWLQRGVWEILVEEEGLNFLCTAGDTAETARCDMNLQDERIDPMPGIMDFARITE